MSELTFQAIPRKRGAPDVVCRFGDDVVYRDVMNPAKQTDRRRFADGVCKEVPAIEPAGVEAELMLLTGRLDKLSEQADETQVDLSNSDEIDASRITRP